MHKAASIERRHGISIEEFCLDYITQNKPVIITDAMNSWSLIKEFTFDYFTDKYGHHEVQVYDDLFNFTKIITLKEYIETYFDTNDLFEKPSEIIPYVRWYTKFKNYEFAWSDNFFQQIMSHWDFPYFLPRKNYLLPLSIDKVTTLDAFPGKAVFISARNSRTRLHYDPWCSDAILCQVYGVKKIVMYHPSQKNFLFDGKKCVDIHNPNHDCFPNFKENNNPSFIDILYPGEIIYFPNNWLHDVVTLKDSISLTWNFVHITTGKMFLNYLIENPSIEELEVVKFFINSTK